MQLRRITAFAVLFACCVIALGTYTRLNDAGLGCPDWPGCYGNLTVPETHHAIAQANTAFPEHPVEASKAWPEMIHRYFASALGLLVFFIAIRCIFIRRNDPKHPLKLPLAIVILVLLQGALGMWTVTMNLYPPVVITHLLGGFTTVCLLFLLTARLYRANNITKRRTNPSTFKWGLLGIGVLTCQIALGGWTSANYAATVCSDLPICQNGWTQHINLIEAFRFWGHDTNTYEYAPHLKPDAKITIHAAHRIGAIFTTLYLTGFFLWLLIKASTPFYTRQVTRVALCILITQICLGISNVVFDLPLSIAVMHNGVAALLMMSLILLNVSLYRSKVIPSWHE